MPLTTLDATAKKGVSAVQRYTLLSARGVGNFFRRPFYGADLITQMDKIGVGSLPIVILTGFFTGGEQASWDQQADIYQGKIALSKVIGAHTLKFGFEFNSLSYAGYTEVPRDVMQGYRLMADEAADQWTGSAPTHVFIQGGVGGVAAAVSVQMRARFSPAPALIVVEPDRAACLLASAELGEPTAVAGDLDTLMAGLACGEPSLLAWQELERGAQAFMAVPDEAAVMSAQARSSDPPVSMARQASSIT